MPNINVMTMYWMLLGSDYIGLVCGYTSNKAIDSGLRQLGFKNESDYNMVYPGNTNNMTKIQCGTVVALNVNSGAGLFSQIERIIISSAEDVNSTYIFPTLSEACNVISSIGIWVNHEYYMFCSDWTG